jgi:hypothetical protein
LLDITSLDRNMAGIGQLTLGVTSCSYCVIPIS